MTWVRCEFCDEWWCITHDQHAYECPCPPVDEMDEDPYEPDPDEWLENKRAIGDGR